MFHLQFDLQTAYNESSCTMEHLAVNMQLMALRLLQCTFETVLLLRYLAKSYGGWFLICRVFDLMGRKNTKNVYSVMFSC